MLNTLKIKKMNLMIVILCSSALMALILFSDIHAVFTDSKELSNTSIQHPKSKPLPNKSPARKLYYRSSRPIIYPDYIPFSFQPENNIQTVKLQDEPEIISNSGRKEYENGNFDLAEQLLLDDLYKNGSNLEALITLGMIYYGTGSKDIFRDIVYDTIDLESDNIELYQSTVHFLMEKSDIELAEEIIKLGIEYNPENSEFMYLYGDFLKMMSRYQEAISVYESALILKHTDRTAYYKLAEVASDMGLNAVEIELISAAEELNPEY